MGKSLCETGLLCVFLHQERSWKEQGKVKDKEESLKDDIAAWCRISLEPAEKGIIGIAQQIPPQDHPDKEHDLGGGFGTVISYKRGSFLWIRLAPCFCKMLGILQGRKFKFVRLGIELELEKIVDLILADPMLTRSTATKPPAIETLLMNSS